LLDLRGPASKGRVWSGRERRGCRKGKKREGKGKVYFIGIWRNGCPYMEHRATAWAHVETQTDSEVL